MLLQTFFSLFAITNIPDSTMNSIFRDYIKTYNKNYNFSEYNTRYHIFSDNYNYILYKNNISNFTLGLNNFTDMSRSEFRNNYLNGLVLKNNNSTFDFVYHNSSNTTNSSLPSSIDWRAAGLVTNVKDQGQCGSCWAFSTTGTVEGQHAKVKNNLVSLSEQNLVDCSSSNYGCEGGWPSLAMSYIKQNGVDTEDSYSYVGIDEKCNYNISLVGSFVNNTVLIPRNMSDLYHALGTVGPISIAIDAEDDFQFYKDGIYSSTMCNSDFGSLNHAVLAVGYSRFNGTNFIIVKNSWGSSWGMDGYIYMATTIDNMCGMATNSSYPLIL